MGRRQRDPRRLIAPVEGERTTGDTPRDLVGGQPATPLRRQMRSDLGTPARQEVPDGTVRECPTVRHRAGDQLAVARQDGERVERPDVTDARQHDRRTEQRREPVGLGRPAVPGLRQVLEARQGDHALAAAFADHGGQVGKWCDVGQLVEGEDHRGRPRLDLGSGSGGGSGVGGPAHVVEEAHDEWGDEGLVVPRRRDVHRVAGPDQFERVEVRVARRSQCLLGAEPAEGSRRGRPDSAELTLVGGDDAVEQVPGYPCVRARQDLLRRERTVTVHPAEDGAHVCSLEGCGMQQRGEQGLGTLGPVVPRSGGAAVGRADDHQGACRRQCRAPRGACGQRRPPQPMHAGAVGHGAGGVEQVAVADAPASGGGGVEHVRFRRRGDNGAVGTQDVRNDQRRRLSRSRRTEHEHRMLGLGLTPTASVVTEVDAVPTRRVRVAQRR